MKDFVSFGTDRQSIYFMSTILLKDNINGILVTQFQLAYIRGITHPSHKVVSKLCCEVHYMWWRNRELELQEWEDLINSNKQESYLLLCYLQE